MVMVPNPLDAWTDCFRLFSETYGIFVRTLSKTFDEQRMKREAKLQLTLARPAISVAPSVAPEEEERRLVTRLLHSAAALRPFLAHNRPMTDHSDNPVIHLLVAESARDFVFNFKEAKRSLQHQLHAPVHDDDLSRAIMRDDRLYQQVAGFSHVRGSQRDEAVHDLARELQAGEQHKLASQQME